MAKSRNITFLSKIPEQVSWNSTKVFSEYYYYQSDIQCLQAYPDGKSIKIEVDTNDENLWFPGCQWGKYIKEEDFQYVFNCYAIPG